MLVDSCSFELICVLVDQYVILPCLLCQCLHVILGLLDFILFSSLPPPLHDPWNNGSGKVKTGVIISAPFFVNAHSLVVWRAYWERMGESQSSQAKNRHRGLSEPTFLAEKPVSQIREDINREQEPSQAIHLK